MTVDLDDAQRILRVTRALTGADLPALGVDPHDLTMLTIVAADIGREHDIMLLTPQEILDEDEILSAARVYGEVTRVRPGWLRKHLVSVRGRDLEQAGVPDVPAFVAERVEQFLAAGPELSVKTPEEVAGHLVNDWELDTIDFAAVTAEVTAVFADLGRPLPPDVASDAVEAARCAAIAVRRTGHGGGVIGTVRVVLVEHRNAGRYANDAVLLRRDVEWAWAAGWSHNPLNWPAPEKFDTQIALALDEAAGPDR